MIRHTVAFTLCHEPGSPEEINFMKTARILETIPGVKKFEQLRQTSVKCEYAFGFSMEFDSQNEYDFYSDHPIHNEFVTTRWIPEVVSFQEIDYELY